MNIDSHKKEFDELGYTIMRGFVDLDVANRLKAIAASDSVINQHSHAVLDSDGRKSRLTLWYTPGDDVFGRLSCSDKMDAIMSTLLGGDVSFFHAKLMNKEPKVGGKWEWHQDYGYWYDDGFMTSDMGSCFVALDACTKDNGALSVIPYSHQYGRLDHSSVGEQAGADECKVNEILSRHGTTLCTMDPGDALFFHSNTLHNSGPNLSDQSRLILISSFFRRDNQSIQDDPRYKNKEVELAPHQSILDGAHQLDSNLQFSEAAAHIIS